MTTREELQEYLLAKDPQYKEAADRYQATERFADYFSACMEMFMERFEGSRPGFKQRRNGGIGAFTPDNVAICDWLNPNFSVIADSNHGFKALAIGKLLARQLVSGNTPEELKPFAFSRYAEGWAYGSGTTNCPWV